MLWAVPPQPPAGCATAAREEYSDLQCITCNDDADLSCPSTCAICSQAPEQDADCTCDCARGTPDFIHEACEAGVHFMDLVCKDDTVLTHLK